MGAVAVAGKIYDTVISEAPDKSIELFHGYTYTAHPVACAAALASLDIYESDGLFERSAALEKPFLEELFALADLPLVKDIRGIGMLGAVDLNCDETVGKRGHRALKAFFDAGVLVKMTGDTVILAPPFISSEADLGVMFDRVRSVLETL